MSLVYVFDVLGVSSAKLYSKSQNIWFIIGAAVFFALTGVFFALSLNYKSMAIGNILWVSLAAIFITAVGYFVFKEQITTTQFIGIGIIFIGLLFVNH